MASMRAVLESREKAALVRVEELRAEFERVRVALAEAEEVLNHRVIGLEQYLEALAEQGAPVVTEAAGPAVAEVPVPTAEPRRTVARREDGVSVEVLGPDYQRIMSAFEGADGGSLSARRVAVVLGWDSSVPARVEGARGRMKRLVERGWLM
ncbi:hypothetical protein [Streptomyces sp. ST2-7A]|uniref:hypothetical protein n=1 Tax=Streptomyces sp. ST2-7A TaxID=2907214 RepID=UPI0027E32170|nr:hypothetical protein [Streptomyces sp. ST2-7A]